MPNAVRLHRPSPIAFSLADGRTIIVAPPNRAQVRAAIALDPEVGEQRSYTAASEQLARQLAALVGPKVLILSVRDGADHEHEEDSAPILDSLTYDEETEMLLALTAQSFGLDPSAAVSGSKKNAPLAAAPSDSPTSIESPAISPSPFTAV